MCLPVKPFKVEEEWVYKGLKCAVVLAREAGHRCGYVRILPGHPAWGKHYDDIDVDVHGGLTFGQKETCVAHKDDQGYWLGFDCAHYMDEAFDPEVSLSDPSLSSETRHLLKTLREIHAKYPISKSTIKTHYWRTEEVVKETRRLARQLLEMPLENNAKK